jgi:UDP-N-acetylglucosamine 3-dehydrogenase
MSEAEKAGADGVLRIGVGVMGSNHARVLSELPGVNLVGVVDPDRKTRDGWSLK